MRFHEWLKMNEMSDLATASTDKIKFEISGDYYNYYFKHGPDDFKASFYRYSADYQGKSIPDVFDLSLRGPSGYNATRTAGTSASAVYANLLLAVKKLIETVNVNGFQFQGYAGAMDLVYDRFYKQFLKKDFIRVTPTLYLKKSYLKEKFEKGLDKKSVVTDIYQTNRDWMQRQQKLKSEKARFRKITLMLPTLAGKFVHTQELGLSFVQRTNPAEFSLDLTQLRYYEHKFVTRRYKASIIDLDQQPRPEEIKSFLQTLTTTSFIHDPEAKPLIAMMPAYGVQMPENLPQHDSDDGNILSQYW